MQHLRRWFHSGRHLGAEAAAKRRCSVGFLEATGLPTLRTGVVILHPGRQGLLLEYVTATRDRPRGLLDRFHRDRTGLLVGFGCC